MRSGVHGHLPPTHRGRTADRLALRVSAVVICIGIGLGLGAPFVAQASSAPVPAVAHPHLNRLHVTPTIHPHVGASSSAVIPHLTYYGGRVLANVQVVEVLYGPGTYEAEVSRRAAPSVASLYAGITNSAYFDMLSEYSSNIRDAAGNQGTNQLIGRGSFLNQLTITPSQVNDGATIDDTNISAELKAQVSAGHLPPENGNILYALYFPAGKTITAGPGQTAGAQFCAYHGTTAGQQELYYSVLPDFSTAGMARNCGAGSEFQNLSAVSSHELGETVTDPEVGIAQSDAPPLAWYYDNPTDPNQGENGDICNGQDTTTVGGDGATYTVQKLWSNRQNACASRPPIAVNHFALSMSPATISLAPGSSGSTSVSTTVTSGSAGTVTLSLTGAPTGVTATFNPSSVVAGASSALTLVATSSALAGTYTMNISGVEGSTSQTAGLSLTITSVAPVGTHRAGLVAVNDASAWVMSSTGVSFTSPSLWSSSNFFGSAATLSGDVAGSGHSGLVAVNGDSVWVMLSTGSGFTAPQPWAATSVTGTRATLLGDVNGDGRADLVAVNDDSVLVMLSTGSGFLPASLWSSGPFFGSVTTVAGDVNGDHLVDLVAVNAASTWVLTSTGAGFSAPRPWSAVPFYGARTTLSGDLNGDGKADLVAVNGGSTWVMTSTGSGFAAPAAWSSVAFYGSTTTVLGDVNGDGGVDLIAVNSGSCWVMTTSGTTLSSPVLWSSSPSVGTRETLVGS